MAETRNRQAPARTVGIDARLREISEATEPKGKLYRRGGEDWDPAKVGPIVTPAQRSSARRAEFDRLRDAVGLTPAQASRAMGVNTETGRRYEQARLERATGQARGRCVVNGFTERDVLRVDSVRDISRLCECTWSPMFASRRPAGWLLTFADRSCRFHGGRR
jgi:hypothetical protein